MAVRISRSTRGSSPSRCRVAGTLASGMTADARMMMIVATTSSSTNVYPAASPLASNFPITTRIQRSLNFNYPITQLPRLRLYGKRDGPQLETHHRSAGTGRRPAERQRDRAGCDGVEQDRG